MKRGGVLALGVGALSVALPWLPSMGRAEAVSFAPEPNARAAMNEGFVRYANDRLTVRVRGAPLGVVLREVARQSGLALVSHGALEAPTTIEFHQLPLEEGLRRVLADHSFALEHARPSAQEGDPARSNGTLWVFAKGGEGRKGESVPATSPESSPRADVASRDPLVHAALASEDAWDREEAVEALGERGHPEAVESLGLALQDESEDVRKAAIDALARIGGERAAEALAVALYDWEGSVRGEAVRALAEIGGAAAVRALAIALDDRDPWLREDAVEALGDIGGERTVGLLQRALDDEDPSVREAAVEILTRVEGESE